MRFDCMKKDKQICHVVYGEALKAFDAMTRMMDSNGHGFTSVNPCLTIG